jgi:hypothetical protein
MRTKGKRLRPLSRRSFILGTAGLSGPAAANAPARLASASSRIKGGFHFLKGTFTFTPELAETSTLGVKVNVPFKKNEGPLHVRIAA